MLSVFPLGVLDQILNLIESVSEGFPSYSFRIVKSNLVENLRWSRKLKIAKSIKTAFAAERLVIFA